MSESLFRKIFNSVYWFFLIESIFLLLGIYFDVISYGVDIQTPLMAIGIAFALIVVSLLFIILKNLNSALKKILAKLLVVFIIMLSAYYLLEDHFLITF